MEDTRRNLAAPETAQTPAQAQAVPRDLWRSLMLFNGYRLFVGGLLIALIVVFGASLPLGTSNPLLFMRTSVVYVVLGLMLQFAVHMRVPRFELQLGMQVVTDIVCISILSYASGGIQSNLDMLLLVSLAAAGLVGRSRIALFFAALASIAVLLQHSWAVISYGAPVTQYVQAGLLDIAYFATAGLAYALARYASVSEKLAEQRGVDLINMAEVNRLAIQDMPDGVLVVDGDGVVRQHNASAERLLGYSFPEGAMLEQCSPLLMERFVAWRQDFDSQTVNRKSRLLRLPFSDSPIRIHFLPVEHEGFWGAVLFLEDMRRVQAQSQQLKLAALGRLTANIAHEVRNPLSSISYATELLREGEHDAEQERLFRIIMDNTARLNRIVQDVLQLNRRDRAQAEPLLLADVLPAFVTTLCQAENVDPAIFRVEVGADCVVDFDRGHFDQVLWNLSNNALRFCNKKAGSVQLRAWCNHGEQVLLQVSDDGPGVDADTASQLFEPFFTTAPNGTGLGLYIARELCESNGASLSYQRQSGGACFRIVFGGRDEQ